ncbi:MAG: isocitrate lyase/phosphoenolpyruvate mutase family protein [Deinococcota bacterium]
MTQADKAEQFKQLHHQNSPLVLTNIWDVGSAKAVADAGAPALATGSASLAAAHGYADREQLPLEQLITTLNHIVDAVNIPVSADIEAGYASEPTGVAETVRQVIGVGVVGINLEDQVMVSGGRYSVTDQAARLVAARKAADALDVNLFINARTDVYLQTEPAARSDDHVEEVLTRARAYQEAGASGLFVPGLADADIIQHICSEVSLPVNIIKMDDTFSVDELAALGVSRISTGPEPYRTAMKTLVRGYYR